MKLVKGTNLTPRQVEEVKRAFLYRLTIENAYPMLNPTGATVDPITDEQWLGETSFYIRNDGHLAKRPGHCEPACMADNQGS